MDISQSLRSQKAQLLATAVTASLVTAGAITAYQSYSRTQKRRDLAREINEVVARKRNVHKPISKGPHPDREENGNAVSGSLEQWELQRQLAEAAREEKAEDYDEELIREQLARCYAVFKEDGMKRVRGGRVAVVGCGGVGSWAAVMLVRSGVSHIRLIDFDYVSLSSLNRHATAILADVGTPKVSCIARTLRQIARWVKVECCVDVWRKEDAGRLLQGVDWVVDAIDNITTKVDLLKYCHSNGLKVISSMGAGAKRDPTRIQISDISHTFEDQLAHSVRVRLRKLGVNGGIPVVYSTEAATVISEDGKKTRLGLLPLDEKEFEKGNVSELAFDDDWRVRVLPVLGPLPSIFGLHIATYIICELAGQPIERPLWVKGRRKTYEKLLRDLRVREEAITGDKVLQVPINEFDVAYIFEDLHHARSSVPPYVVPSKPNLARWDHALPLSVENCLVLDGAGGKDGELQRHLDAAKEGKRPEEIWGEEAARVVRGRQRQAREWRAGMLGLPMPKDAEQ